MRQLRVVPITYLTDLTDLTYLTRLLHPAYFFLFGGDVKAGAGAGSDIRVSFVCRMVSRLFVVQ
jgi:hypothetical protein